MKSLSRILALTLLVAVSFTITSVAQDAVTLAIKSETGKVHQYSINMGGNLSFELDGLPIPNSKITGENLQASISLDSYFDTTDVQDEYLSFDVKLLPRQILLGGLLQLPNMSGEGAPPEIMIEMTPQVGVQNIEVLNLGMPGMGGDMMKNMMPGGDDMGMDFASLDTLLPMIIGLFPAVFPEDPVAVGDKWSQKPSAEDMPLPIFPVIEMRYLLESIDGTVANIKFKSKGDYDAEMLKSFLSMIPEIPMGEDEMTIDDIDIFITWDVSGTMLFDIETGLIKDVQTEGVVDISAGGSLTFMHPDGNTEPWTPLLTAKLELNSAIKYAGEVSREELEILFPPQLEEDGEEGVILD